jgi:hypothetical protein
MKLNDRLYDLFMNKAKSGDRNIMHRPGIYGRDNI